MKWLFSRFSRNVWVVALVFAAPGLNGQPVEPGRGEYADLKARAENLVADGSYSLAHDLYKKADKQKLPLEEARWVDFRLADTSWRSEAATQKADTTKIDEAGRNLNELIRDIQREDEKDLVWAEVHESLGDFEWTRRDRRNWHGGWQHYQQALDWWAGSADLDTARERYLEIIWKAVTPPQRNRHYYYGYYGNWIPIQYLDNVLKIARDPGDLAHAHYLAAMTLRNQGTQQQRRRVVAEFEAAITPGGKTDWFDDALFHYAMWMEQTGRSVRAEKGQWRTKSDYVKALALYRQLVDSFVKGETRFYDQAKNAITRISEPSLGVHVSNIFLPLSEIQFNVNWRNLEEIDFALYPVDLNRDVDLVDPDKNARAWLSTINLDGKKKQGSWSKDTEDKGKHRPSNDTIRLDDKLPPGAYVLEARAKNISARELVLVSDATLVTKSSETKTIAYFCNALDGSPIAGAGVHFHVRVHDGDKWRWHDVDQQTGKDGITILEIPGSPSHLDIFASAVKGDRQAFSFSNAYAYHSNKQQWKIYAYTDRPAYRPDETVQWKFTARTYDGAVYTTPFGKKLNYEIKDSRDSSVDKGTVTLNAFGSAWGDLALTEKMALGPFSITFWNEDSKKRVGSSTLFRLEEYKLPEFRVSVKTPEQDGKKRAYRLGEQVEVEIGAQYYFGGPVANASVEVLVYQDPFYHWWAEPREYSWFYSDLRVPPRHYGGGQVIKRESLKTDGFGKARLVFDTPENSPQDFQYRIEARVVDASRREITGRDTVRVTRQRFYVYPQAGHNLYQPQDKVRVIFKTLDANEQPVEVEGLVTVTRERYVEVWVDPRGEKITGAALKKVRARHLIFPPPPREPDDPTWRLTFSGYEKEEIFVRPLKSNKEGQAVLEFIPEREGYYRVHWHTPDEFQDIHAETTVWVTTRETTELGYHFSSGVEIIADKDTFRAGEKAPVMLVTTVPDRYVLFSVEGEDVYDYRLVHLTGNVKLVELPLGEEHVPNIFLNAIMVHDRAIHTDTEQIVVPPVKNFLTVEIESDREEYRPRESGTVKVRTLDVDGNPVSTEVALGVVDESVYSIQGELAGDPRQFYFGTKRSHRVRNQSTFQQKNYIRWVKGPEDTLVDEDDRQPVIHAGQRGDRLDTVVLPESKNEFQKTKRLRSGVFGMDMKGAPVPGIVAPAAEIGVMMDSLAASSPETGRGGDEPAVVVRSDFRSTVFWKPDVVTDERGEATVEMTYPDSLTTWKATVRVVSRLNQFGIADTTTVTRQPLIARLQAPRFFVVGDEVILSAVINNNTSEPMKVNPALDVDGLQVTGFKDKTMARIEVPANGEVRVDWVARVEQAGEAKIKIVARGKEHADAMEKTYPVYEHGVERFIAQSGKVRNDDVIIKLDIPEARKKNATRMVVDLSPSIAVTMLDALPYLIDYPYGCTEQTMSRFMPAVVVSRTLTDLGLKPEDIAGKIVGGIEQEFTGKTQPKGKKDLKKLDDMVNKSLKRLEDFQHSDGGWGWWKKGDSDHFMSAYVTWGLVEAERSGTKVRRDVIKRAVDYLDKELVEEEDHVDMQAWMLHALSAHSHYKKQHPSKFQAAAMENLWKNRDRLNAYTRALLALSAHYRGEHERAGTLVDNLRNGVKMDDSPDTSIVQRGKQTSHDAVISTAHWGEDGIYWRWSDGGVEATAFALRALLTIDPENDLIEPVMNWLVKNRRGGAVEQYPGHRYHGPGPE